jgi:phospholipase C
MADAFPEIRHIVLLLLENRSFDHMLGGLPGMNGA